MGSRCWSRSLALFLLTTTSTAIDDTAFHVLKIDLCNDSDNSDKDKDNSSDDKSDKRQ